MSKVILTKTKNSQESINDSISKILDKLDLPKNVDNLMIKPNLCYYWKYSTGYTTDPKVVSGIIDKTRSLYGSDVNIKIAEADATAMRVNHAFTMLDYRKLAKNKDVALINLSEGKTEKRKITINNKKTLQLLKTTPGMKVAPVFCQIYQQ